MGTEPDTPRPVEPGDTTSEFFGAVVAAYTSLMTLVVSESDEVKKWALAALAVIVLGYCVARTWRKKGPPQTAP